ncbi:hypothetical protein LL912_24400 [Niabella sp. CC-SYL272]|uniref:hypothetical protein n=1 Tax=Niabella agricola TaxID=2891571 RepID=UPI001F265539|nr:hypothetical protein [Niabella agricola]MCF3111952.1 hypothetical protein [Niabella agricola]
MKKNTPGLLLMLALLLTATTFTQAQSVSADSIKTLKLHKEILKQTTELNKQKLNLADYQNKLVKLQTDLEKANKDAAKSAAESKDYAQKMAKNPGDEKLARKAKKAAKNSSSSHNKAEKLTSSVVSMQRNITKTSDKITDLEKKIATLRGKG